MVLQANVEKRKQIIVITPEEMIGDEEISRRVTWLGSHERGDIVYLVLVDDPERVLSVRRSMTTIMGIASTSSQRNCSMVTTTRSWLETLEKIYQPGDMFVIHSEQTVRAGFGKTIPIQDFLHEKFHAQAAVLSGFYRPQQAQIRQWLRELIFWGGCLALLGAFFWLEIELNHLTLGSAKSITGIALVAIEIAAVWGWTRIIHRIH